MTEMIPAPARRRRGGRCCLLGCGGCLTLLILLGAAAWIGYARYGSPWIEAQASRLTERFPALGAIVRLKDSLPLRGVTLTGDEMGSRDAADFPEDIWLPPGAADRAFNIGERSALAALTLSRDDAPTLANEIRKEMETRGWRRTPVRDPHDGLALLFEKDDRSVSYFLYSREGRLQVVIKSLDEPTS